MKKPYQEEAERAVDIADEILELLDAQEEDPNISQSALGNAWFRLCLAMKIEPKFFKEMCKGLYNSYAEKYEKFYEP